MVKYEAVPLVPSGPRGFDNVSAILDSGSIPTPPGCPAPFMAQRECCILMRSRSWTSLGKVLVQSEWLTRSRETSGGGACSVNSLEGLSSS